MSYAMALDNSWDILSEDEMYDVNGGVNVSNFVLGLTIDIAIYAIGYGVAAYAAKTTGAISKGVFWLRGVYNSAVSTLTSAVGRMASFFNISGKFTSGLAGVIGSNIWMGLGGLIALGIDYIQDGRVDGYVKF